MPTTESFEKLVAPGVVRRADRGLCLAGRRITLYLVMDYLQAGWPSHLISHWLGLNEAEVTNAINYIEAHRQEFEAEYADVVQSAAEREAYWRKIDRERPANLGKRHHTRQQAAAWDRLKTLEQEGPPK
jgi:uncharacterized protein (DUF433 family)